jgi:dsDNA-specific endonuclease/ATPase MutS2
MPPIDINTLVVLLFGAGGAGAIAGVVNVIKTLRSGKIENEETLIRRLDADNRKQQELREAAEKRADEAEKEAEVYRKQRNKAREHVAQLRWHIIETYGKQPPKFGEEE